MKLVAVRMLYCQLFLEEGLPLERELSLDQVRHYEELVILATFDLDRRHLLLLIQKFIVDLQLECSFGLLQFLNELKVNQVKSLNITNLHKSFLLDLLKTFQSDISCVFVVVPLNLKLILKLKSGLHIEHNQ